MGALIVYRALRTQPVRAMHALGGPARAGRRLRRRGGRRRLGSDRDQHPRGRRQGAAPGHWHRQHRRVLRRRGGLGAFLTAILTGTGRRRGFASTPPRWEGWWWAAWPRRRWPGYVAKIVPVRAMTWVVGAVVILLALHQAARLFKVI
jgi:uncharacterized MAPEG superfamily protein